MDQVWIVGAFVEDHAGPDEATRLKRVMDDGGLRHVVIAAVGDGHLRVSFQVDAPTAEQAEHQAVAVLERYSNVIGFQPDSIKVTAH